MQGDNYCVCWVHLHAVYDWPLVQARSANLTAEAHKEPKLQLKALVVWLSNRYRMAGYSGAHTCKQKAPACICICQRKIEGASTCGRGKKRTPTSPSLITTAFCSIVLLTTLRPPTVTSTGFLRIRRAYPHTNAPVGE